MDDVRLARELIKQGYAPAEITRLARAGELKRIRRGAYVVPVNESDTRVGHRQLIDATLGQLDRGGVISHVSAAVLHGLPVWNDDLERVHLTRSGPGGGNRAAGCTSIRLCSFRRRQRTSTAVR